MRTVLLVFLFALVPLGAVRAQEEQPTDDQVNAIAKGLYCPVCENVPLDVCPTQACIQWRNTIREKLAEGWSQEQIERFFVDQYGDRVLATPPASGLNWLVYVLPPLFFLAGALLLTHVVRSWRRAGAEASAEVSSVSPTEDPYLERVEEELKRRI